MEMVASPTPSTAPAPETEVMTTSNASGPSTTESSSSSIGIVRSDEPPAIEPPPEKPFEWSIPTPGTV